MMRIWMLLVCFLTMGLSASAEEVFQGLPFQENVILMQKIDRSSQYNPSGAVMASVPQDSQYVGGLAVAEDKVLFNQAQIPSTVATVEAKKQVRPISLNELATEGLTPEENRVALNTVRPAPPPPVFWYDRSPLAIHRF